MKRILIRIGSVFAVKLDDNSTRYFQYVANDTTQLNSEVISVFKRTYHFGESPDLNDVVAGDIDFFAHVVIRWGVQAKLWEKVGDIARVGKVDISFRDSHDYGDPNVRKSTRWIVWKINTPFIEVGELSIDHQSAEIGIVVTPTDIIDRIKTGKYDFAYPEY